MAIQLVQLQPLSLSELQKEVQEEISTSRFEHLQDTPITEIEISHTLTKTPATVQFYKILDNGNLEPLYYVNYKLLKEFSLKKLKVQFVEPTRFLLILGIT